MALVKCKECGEEISRKAKQCPKCGSPQKRTSRLTWLVLILILILVIGKVTGVIESSPPSTKPDAEVAAQPKISYKEQAIAKTKLEFRWSKSGFDNVMMANFIITNNSDLKIKDIEIRCTHYAPSGTKIDQNNRTIYETVEEHSTKTVTDFNMGFIHTQAQNTRCEIHDLVIESIISR